MNKIFFLLSLCPLFGFHSDCTADFTYRPIKIGSEYSIEMNLKDGSSQEYALELYDLNTDDLVSEKRVVFTTGDIKVVFENIKPSTYMVYYSSLNCNKKPLKGMGIILN